MKRPAFQFYPADWVGNKKLRRCSIAAHGAWIALLCLLHDSDEYGIVRWPLQEIAENLHKVTVKLLLELVEKGVLKGSDGAMPAFIHIPRHGGRDLPGVTLIAANSGPCWYSSRMVHDEWARQTRGATTRFGASRELTQPDTQPHEKARQGAPPSRVPSQIPNRVPSRREGDGASTASAFEVQELSVGENLGTCPVDNPELLADKSAKGNGYKRISPWHKDFVQVMAEASKQGIERRPNESEADFTDRVRHHAQHQKSP